MRNTSNHLSDEQLLRAADGELSSRELENVNVHLAGCGVCCARMTDLQNVASEFAHAYHSEFDPALDGVNDSREALKARMAGHAGASPTRRWLDRAADFLAAPRFAYVAAAILILAMGAWFASHEIFTRDSQNVTAVVDAGPLLPVPGLTPGATRPVSAREVCVPGPSDQMATIPMPERKAVFHEYGIDGASARNYEVDHLITPELGGTDDIRNLWPEPYSSATWNAYVKDELEDHLRRMVCDGRLDLPTAQRDIATNWIAAYQKYFHTDKPLAKVSSVIWHEKGERAD